MSLKILNWKNLRQMRCPYCGEELSRDIKIRCTKCFFSIYESKFNAIVRNRTIDKEDGYDKNKWQNLHYMRCPIEKCSQRLFENTDEFGNWYVCSSSLCNFKINVYEFLKIMNNPRHSANKFYNGNSKKTQTDDYKSFRYENRN